MTFKTSEVAVFDMSTIILHNTFKTTMPLVEATLSETFKRCDIFATQ